MLYTDLAIVSGKECNPEKLVDMVVARSELYLGNESARRQVAREARIYLL